MSDVALVLLGAALVCLGLFLHRSLERRYPRIGSDVIRFYQPVNSGAQLDIEDHIVAKKCTSIVRRTTYPKEYAIFVQGKLHSVRPNMAEAQEILDAALHNHRISADTP